MDSCTATKTISIRSPRRRHALAGTPLYRVLHIGVGRRRLAGRHLVRPNDDLFAVLPLDRHRFVSGLVAALIDGEIAKDRLRLEGQQRFPQLFRRLFRNPTVEMDGKVYLSNSIRLPDSSVTNALRPVTLPPGRASEATTPTPGGSPMAAMTMGMVVVAAFAARAAGVPRVTIRSTRLRTSSATSSGKRSPWPWPSSSGWGGFAPPRIRAHAAR